MKTDTNRHQRRGVTELVLRTTVQLLEIVRAHGIGACCPSEMEMAERFGVSRTTIRES